MSYYKVKDLENYFKMYKKSVREPRKFWDRIADENFVWYQRWDKVFEYDMQEAQFKWFLNAKVNITKNCIDRHLAKRGDKTAIIFEPNNPDESVQHISYNELYVRVSKMANVLRDLGIKKGDRVCIYLPMIPDLAIAVLACARIGAIHSVVFAGFSAGALEARITDSDCKMVITSDGAYRGDKTINLKSIVDEALEKCPSVEKVLVVKRTNENVSMKDGRDIWAQPLLDAALDNNVAEIMDAEDPLFILYTSGSTGKPKGMVHTTAGYMVYTAYTFKNVFNYEENDVYWCTADIGWITGHSYILYGPLLNGATTVIFEGVPSYPDFSRFWEVIEKHNVTQFYTAPTAIRALAKESLDYVQRFPLSSLKVIGSVGEPINEEAWHWYNDHVGGKRCPLVDTWWQTETGGVLIAPLPNAGDMKPGSAMRPMYGVQPAIVDGEGNVLEGACEGNLVLLDSWPGQMRSVYGDHQRFIETYFSTFKGTYFTGDGARRDENGDYWITGRVDDVLNVSGHRLGTAEIESALVAHAAVAEAAVVGMPDDTTGESICAFVVLKQARPTGEDAKKIALELRNWVAKEIGPIAKPKDIRFGENLPKTRSGKIMRRLLRSIAKGEAITQDTSTLENPAILEQLAKTNRTRVRRGFPLVPRSAWC